MDPQASWDQLLSAYAEGNWDRTEELALALSDWLNKGGFPPTVLGQDALGPEFDRALARAGCDFILDVLSARWTTPEAKGALA